MYSVIEKIVKRCKQVVLRSFSSLTNNQTTRPSNGETMKVLNVAEKNDAAKNIASILGRGNCRRVSTFTAINDFFIICTNNKNVNNAYRERGIQFTTKSMNLVVQYGTKTARW